MKYKRLDSNKIYLIDHQYYYICLIKDLTLVPDCDVQKDCCYCKYLGVCPIHSIMISLENIKHVDIKYFDIKYFDIYVNNYIKEIGEVQSLEFNGDIYTLERMVEYLKSLYK